MSGSLENRHRSHLVVSHCLQNKQKSFSGLTLYIEWIHHFYILVQLFFINNIFFGQIMSNMIHLISQEKLWIIISYVLQHFNYYFILKN